jgi:predicted NBD/HSP70 family sugar kinase
MQSNFVADGSESPARGFAQSGVRLANERAVLTLIAMHPGSSNADLARLSGLGPQTTSRIVTELEARELVQRGAVLRGRRGQPATPLFLNPGGAYVIGVEIGWRHFEVLLLAMSGKVLASIRRSYAYPDIDTIFGEVSAEIATLRAGMSRQQKDRLVGIGLATPAWFHAAIERLGAPPEQAARWRGLDIAGRLAGSTGLAVEWVNDGNAACWGEWLALTMPRPRAFAAFHIGTFVGAGIATEGAAWEGRSGNAANLGAILVPGADGQPTAVHEVASLMALQRRLEQAGQVLPAGNPLNWDWAALEPVAGPWLDEAGKALATAILSARAVVDLDRIAIDGVMPRAVICRLVELVAHHLALLPACGERPEVGMGHLGGAAAATGAGQILLFRRFFSRAWSLFAA